MSVEVSALAADQVGVALRAQVAAQIMRFFQLLQAGTAGGWLEVGLSMPQLKTLLTVEQMGPAPMSQVAERLGVSDSAATGLIDRLVEHSLARRQADSRDRRVVRVAATAQGRALVDQLRSASGERIADVLAQLNAKDLHRVGAVFELLGEAAARRRADCTDSTAHAAVIAQEGR